MDAKFSYFSGISRISDLSETPSLAILIKSSTEEKSLVVPSSSQPIVPPLSLDRALAPSAKEFRSLKALVSSCAPATCRSIKKNFHRLEFKKKQNTIIFPTYRGQKDQLGPVQIQSEYIDKFYPNTCRSNFTNRVSLPGDWDFNSGIFKNRDRVLEQRKELEELNELPIDQSPEDILDFLTTARKSV